MMFTKALVYVCIFLTILCFSFGYLSYRFYSQNAVLEERVETIVRENNSLYASMVKQEQLCLLADSLTTEFKKGEAVIEKETDEEVSSLDKLISSNNQKKDTTVGGSNAVQSNVADLNAELPDDVVRLLSSSCLHAKGEACDTP